MKKFSELTEEEIKARIAKLDKDIEANPPTPAQSLWYKFSVWNKGCEWVDKKTGKRITKFDMWVKFYNNEKELTKVTEELNPRYMKRLKVGWTHFITIGGHKIIIREEEKAAYHKKEKEMINRRRLMAKHRRLK